MKAKILKGSAINEGAFNRSWIVGHFKNPQSLLHSDDVEIKWNTLEKGEENESFAAQSEGTTISILVSGRVNYRFRTQHGDFVGSHGTTRIQFDETTESLINPGEFLIWKPLVYHYWKAMEDSLVVTVRWPSKKDDVYQMAK